MSHSDKRDRRARPALGWRSAYRDRQHDSAHAENGDAGPELEHPLSARGAAQLITQEDQALELIDHLRASGSFAYDSEFIGELTYYPRLCLIQVATTQRVALIDPMADVDLLPFWELVCDASVEKVVHAGAQDLEPAVRLLNKRPANVIDTQIAAGFVRLAYPVSLSKLVAELIGAKLGKSLTFSRWDHRPLSAIQLRYAADDVRYLPAVRAELGRRLDELGHAAWASEECAAECDPAQFGFDPDSQYLRVRGAGSLGGSQLAVLRELTIWRDQAARQTDVPPRTMLRDEALIHLARSPGKSIEQLERARLPKNVQAEHGEAIVATMARALATPASTQPAKSIEPSPSERFRADALFSTICTLAAAAGIDPALVVSRHEVGELSRRIGASQSIEDLRLMKGWRAQAVGKRLVQLLSHEGRVSLSWADQMLRMTT
ncbi:MAG: ribonuclease D [Tepidisphaeraceae bacterium]